MYGSYSEGPCGMSEHRRAAAVQPTEAKHTALDAGRSQYTPCCT